ncbi:hypothetical protein A4H97_31800 [Niastella yeongjuensis]|uniref:Uncharacterized protein n=1 Tax=Niastella yeongjuensis TaxID=354355 RepID=A0A1V9EJ53_9BACT|nr:hypothetical protein A4H97_31800 [Niastella yeongjuensis]
MQFFVPFLYYLLFKIRGSVIKQSSVPKRDRFGGIFFKLLWVIESEWLKGAVKSVPKCWN